MSDWERDKRDELYRTEFAGFVFGDERQPRFGERMRGIWASERNPQRDGIFVKVVTRSGRRNPGRFYQLTDGKGKFWLYRDIDTVFLEEKGDG